MSSEVTGPVDPTPADSRPEGLPDQFSSVEQLAQSHLEAQRKITELSQQAAGGEAQAPEAPASAGLPTGIPEAPAQPETPAVWSEDALARYSTSVAQTGDIAPEDRAALTAAGIPDAQITQYVQGWQAQQQLATAKIYGITGDQGGYEKMVQWASTALPQGEQQAFNDALNSGNVDAAAAATRGLWAQFQSASGNPMAVRGATTTSGVAPFRSMQEMIDAQKDPKYKSRDAAYLAEFDARLAASDFYK